MSLVSAEIRNFQSHKKTTLNFNKGLNVITGDTDSGKSSLMRSLIWCITNKPSGDSFRSHFGGETSVEIELENDVVIGRRKDKSDNLFYLSQNENHMEEFRAFGQGVPDEIAQEFNIDGICIQGQHDSSFLLSESSGGEIAKVFNKIANLSDIDTALANIKRKGTKIKNEVEFTSKHLEELKESLQSYTTLEERTRLVKEYESLSDRKKVLETSYVALNFLVNSIKKCKTEIEDLDSIISSSHLINKANQKNKKTIKTKTELKNLKNSINSIKILSEEIEQNTSILKSNKIIDDASEINSKLNTYLIDKKLITKQIKKWNDIDSEIEEIDNNIMLLEKEIEETFPDICPLCGK